MITAIDPGTTQSAFVRAGFKHKSDNVLDIHSMDILPNEAMVEKLRSLNHFDDVAIEMVACYGMAVGKEIFETCVWIGRFIEAVESNLSTGKRQPVTRVYRKEVKLTLCNSHRAKDANVRQALLDMYPPIGGGKTPQVGTKNQPGPLYGVKSHLWSALAVAVVHAQNQETKPF